MHPTTQPALVDRATRSLRSVRTPRDTVGQDEFNEIAREYEKVLLRYVRRLTSSDWHLAEDIVQETLLRAWSRPRPDNTGSLRAWLFTIARNLVFDHHRARRCRPAEAYGEDLDATPLVDERLEQIVDGLVVRGALDVLSPSHRAVLESVYWGGRSTVETADVLGIPAGTVKSRLHYAQRALRLAIGGTYEPSSACRGPARAA